MDIYRFLDSNDIRAHLQSLRYDFTLPEAAFLVWQCATAPLSEKHAAWRELIKTMPDCRMERRRNMCEIQSMHGFLQEYIELEEKQLRGFPSGIGRRIFLFCIAKGRTFSRRLFGKRKI